MLHPHPKKTTRTEHNSPGQRAICVWRTIASRPLLAALSSLCGPDEWHAKRAVSRAAQSALAGAIQSCRGAPKANLGPHREANDGPIRAAQVMQLQNTESHGGPRSCLATASAQRCCYYLLPTVPPSRIYAALACEVAACKPSTRLVLCLPACLPAPPGRAPPGRAPPGSRCDAARGSHVSLVCVCRAAPS